MKLARRCRSRKARPDVFLGAFRREPNGPRPVTNEKIAFGGSFDPFPLQEYRFRAALAVHDADRLALNGLHLWINACAHPITKSVADHLREMKHEFVIAFELIVLNADHRAVIGYADQ